MGNKRPDNLLHLRQFREVEASYQTLLQTARQIIKERSWSAMFVAEDLWARDRKTSYFGTLDPQQLSKTKKIATYWVDEDRLTIQRIREFLEYAVTRGDMYRTPLVGTELCGNGFAFVVPVQTQTF